MRNPEKSEYAQNMRKYVEICAAHISPLWARKMGAGEGGNRLEKC